MAEQPDIQQIARGLYRGWQSRPTKVDPTTLRAQLFLALRPELRDATTPCPHCGTMALLYHEGICPCSTPGEHDGRWEVDQLDDFRFHPDHIWLHDGNVGITEYAQEQMGDIIFLDLPAIGTEVTQGEPCGTLESCKTLQNLVSPVGGIVTAINEAAVDEPEIVNTDPYFDGWLFTVEATDEAPLSGAEYLATLDSEE